MRIEDEQKLTERYQSYPASTRGKPDILPFSQTNLVELLEDFENSEIPIGKDSYYELLDAQGNPFQGPSYDEEFNYELFSIRGLVLIHRHVDGVLKITISDYKDPDTNRSLSPLSQREPRGDPHYTTSGIEVSFEYNGGASDVILPTIARSKKVLNDYYNLQLRSLKAGVDQ